MTLKLSDVVFEAHIPDVPASLPVFELAAPTLEERKGAIGRLAEHLKLGELRSATLDHGVVMASQRGDIHYFHASGALWARDATASQGTADELRRWDGLVETNDDGHRAALNADAAKRLVGQAKELLNPLGLLSREVSSEAVQLDQVAHLDAKGKEIAHGAGQATIKFQYAVGGIPVRGAGAKTLLFAEPGQGQARFAGLFHAWRPLGKTSSVKLPKAEEALTVGVLQDPELERYQAAGHKVQITRLEFVYLALPAMLRQTHLFPAFQVEGSVGKGKLGIAFDFARFHHAAPPAAYASADVYGSYLTVNPDGIRPTPAGKPEKN